MVSVTDIHCYGRAHLPLKHDQPDTVAQRKSLYPFRQPLSTNHGRVKEKENGYQNGKADDGMKDKFGDPGDVKMSCFIFHRCPFCIF